MDAQGLPIVSPKIDFREVDHISKRRLLCFLNHFAAHTVAFLNTFATSCEQRLAEVNCRIQKTEATLSVLEAKLSSLPGLDHVSAPLASSALINSSAPFTSSTPVVSSAPSRQTELDAPMTLPELPRTDEALSPSAGGVLSPLGSSADADINATSSSTSASGRVRAADHPDYAKYFRMLHLGVPLMAVSLKCRTENPHLDVTVLETPEVMLSVDSVDSRPMEASDDEDDRGWSQ